MEKIGEGEEGKGMKPGRCRPVPEGPEGFDRRLRGSPLPTPPGTRRRPQPLTPSDGATARNVLLVRMYVHTSGYVCMCPVSCMYRGSSAVAAAARYPSQTGMSRRASVHAYSHIRRCCKFDFHHVAHGRKRFPAKTPGDDLSGCSWSADEIAGDPDLRD